MARAVARENRQVAGAGVGRHDVNASVRVNVVRKDRERQWADGQRGGAREAAFAVAHEHRHAVGFRVGDGDVNLSVAVEVCERERDGAGADRSRVRRIEVSLAVAEQYGDAVRRVVRDGEVCAPVRVDVARDDGDPLFATAMSGTRSPSKSAVTTDTGSEPASSSSAGRKENARQTDVAEAAGRANEFVIKRRTASAARRVEMFTTNAPYRESDDGEGEPPGFIFNDGRNIT